MRFSEVLLRIGCSLAAWMVVVAYFIWLAVVLRVECSVDGDEIYRLLLGVAPIAAGASFLLGAARPFPEIFTIFRWIGIPVLLLLLLTVPVIWTVFSEVNRGSAVICGPGTGAGWHSLWAPIQFAATAICTLNILRLWRSQSDSAEKR